MGSETGLDKVRYEKEWAAQEARLRLDSESRSKWEASTYTFRPFIYYKKILVAWEQRGASIVVKDVFTVVSMDANFREGVWVKVRDQSGKEHIITHTPRLLGDSNIFAWIPYFNEVRWHAGDWTDPTAPKSLRLAACFKMQYSPNDPLLDGQEYLSELHVFRHRFPEYAKTRF
jgi:hypothetical protein